MELFNPQLIVTAPWINGQPRPQTFSFKVLDPFSQKVLAEVDESDERLTNEAIVSAKCAFAEWRLKGPRARHAALLNWAAHIEAAQQDLARIICYESGKPLGQASSEINHCITLLRWFAEEARRVQGSTLPLHTRDKQQLTLKEPIGVVACITPWNFPAASIIVKAGAAIAAGCSCIVKPSEETPLIALALAKLASESGLAPGLFNVLPCSQPENIGKLICKNADIRLLSFTGSYEAGKKLFRQCASSMKRMTFELGGNAPFIVFDDCDLDSTVEALINARFYNSGQICVGANRIFIQQGIYDIFVQALAKRIAQLKVGNSFDSSTDIGPIINRSAIARLSHLIDDAKNHGASVICGGSPLDQRSQVFLPTLLSNMTTEMEAYSAEIFGPIACLYPFHREDEVIALANNTHAGLASYVFTRDFNRTMRMMHSLEAGAIGLNTTGLFSEDAPFGGIKQSGFGKEQGIDCLEEFFYTKTVSLGWQS